MCKKWEYYSSIASFWLSRITWLTRLGARCKNSKRLGNEGFACARRSEFSHCIQRPLVRPPQRKYDHHYECESHTDCSSFLVRQSRGRVLLAAKDIRTIRTNAKVLWLARLECGTMRIIIIMHRTLGIAIRGDAPDEVELGGIRQRQKSSECVYQEGDVYFAGGRG